MGNKCFMENVQMEKHNASNVLKNVVTHLMDGISGTIVKDKKEVIALATNQIVKGLISGNLLSNLYDTWKWLEVAGRIPKDYKFGNKHYNCLGEILDYLDNGVPNDEVFAVLKKIFLTAVINDETDGVLAYQYIRFAKGMSSGELLVLFHSYYLSNNDFPKDISLNTLFKKIAEKSGLMHSNLVYYYYESLANKNLYNKIYLSDIYAPRQFIHYKANEFGTAFCEYVEKYDALTKDFKNKP